jgi:hypothetical protein
MAASIDFHGSSSVWNPLRHLIHPTLVLDGCIAGATTLVSGSIWQNQVVVVALIGIPSPFSKSTF